MDEVKGKLSKKMKGIIIGLCILLVIYIGFSVYFRNHFYFGSTINGINVSGKSVEAADEKISSQIESYTLELEERGDVKENIKASDIGLNYNSNGNTQKIKENQNPYTWFIGIFANKDSSSSDIISYNDEKLKNYINTLSCFDKKNVVEPKSPTFKYDNNGYSIVDEVNGNKVNKDSLNDKICEALKNMDNSINLEDKDCYEKPKYTKESKEVLAAKDTLGKYVNSKITYTFGDSNEVLDGQTIQDFLSVNDNFDVIIDEGKVKKYVNTLAGKHDTIGKTRDFTTTGGNVVKVSGGDYGWEIDKSKETQDLVVEIKEGQTINKEPKYAQTAINHNANDIGNTYVEISLSQQHLWFYKNGSLVVQGDIVTGSLSDNKATPAGTYKVEYKERNAVLKGANYAQPVSFWMPFILDEGIGMHDATWRSDFGGSIYMSSGSHGCVNCPYNLADTIYNNIDSGTPVICYY
ncbi:L,D-transpeptidase/peptidoglycan binding protein [Clostridium sp. SHJSY1]|uniref:L,D-transpeptidase family protein n=1 Tax=Clostridium sp. SHJSY1 TaxID=2942483 RepID=UPI0028747847|nr:peptidoglycan binding domain-containing protein [Clostridium sp. SHJSY1]MDS0524512.1 L,D-transpeptidase/peptidoglycan binding protein [Clostridium sp. SHJSY1]